MICPKCQTAFSTSDFEESEEYYIPEDLHYFYLVSHGKCPECSTLLVTVFRGEAEDHPSPSDYASHQIVYPQASSRPVEPEVPESYRKIFTEASLVQNLSPKASAALSRRLLQDIIRNEFQINPSSLSKEIDNFLEKNNLPSYLSEAIDAVRNIGNFAAHPLKDKNTGEIIDVEEGEAEWLLDVLESLFDFAFVQPEKLKERKIKLNKKLKKLGKPPMKTS